MPRESSRTSRPTQRTDKRLDFVSFHHYWAEDRPSQVAQWEREIDQSLKRLQLPTNIPIFVTEIGYAHKWKDHPDKKLWQACGMTAYQVLSCVARRICVSFLGSSTIRRSRSRSFNSIRTCT